VTTCVILLRGINVGGRNRLPMADLRELAESMGLDEPSTYVQSGNLLARTGLEESDVVGSLQDAISERFGLEVPVIFRSGQEFSDIASAHPYSGLGLDDRFLQVAFLDRTPAKEMEALVDAADYEPDRFHQVGREIYLAYPDGSGRSRLNHSLLERRLGVTVTARNWRTIQKLAEMLGDRS
jgi:uncharacterized protein (DUF1697 family)